MKTIAVTGLVTIPVEKQTSVQSEIKKILIQALEDGFDRFLIRAEGDTDMLMANAVLQLKSEGKNLFLEAIRYEPGIDPGFEVDGIYCYPNALDEVDDRPFARDRELARLSCRLILIQETGVGLESRDAYIADTVNLNHENAVIEIVM